MQSTVLANHNPKARGVSATSFAQWRERLLSAEQGAGWLAECDDAGRFLAVSREFVDALSLVLRRLAGDGPVLEICAGSGELARALASEGVRVRATDAAPAGFDGPAGTEYSSGPPRQVLQMSARQALRSFEPTVVLGAFVPFDAGIDEAVIACPSVQHYVVLSARVGGSWGVSAFWRTAGWRMAALEGVASWMLTRHDVWLGGFHRGHDSSRSGLLQHGEAWLLSRTTVPSSCGCSCWPRRC